MNKIFIIKQKCSSDKLNPRDAKIDLAHELTRDFMDKNADKAKATFISRLQNKDVTDDIPLLKLKIQIIRLELLI